MGYYLVHTTYPILFVAVLARQLCLPVPAILFLLSAGALAGSGKLSYAGILIAAVAGCVIADSVWFEAGRIGGKRILRLLCTFTADPSYCIRRGQTTFQKVGARLLIVAKFVPGLDGITPPLAGMFGTPTATFLFFDAIGASLWAGAYIGCGFLFAEELDKVARNISSFANAVVLIFGVPLLVFFVWKLLVLIRMIRFLRAFRIPPEELKSRLDSGEKIGETRAGTSSATMPNGPRGPPPRSVRPGPPSIPSIRWRSAESSAGHSVPTNARDALSNRRSECFPFSGATT